MAPLKRATMHAYLPDMGVGATGLGTYEFVGAAL